MKIVRILLALTLVWVLLLAGMLSVSLIHGRKLLDCALNGRMEMETQAPVTQWALKAEMNENQAAVRVNGWLNVVERAQVQVQTDRGTLFADDYAPVSGDEDAPWAIVFHGGLGSSRQQVLDVACELSLAGYRVLTPDLYAHGESAGNISTLGVCDAQDVRAWIEMICSWNPEAQIVLYGVDEGAACVYTAAAQGLGWQVAAIALDSLCIDNEARALKQLERVCPDAGRWDKAAFALAYRFEHGAWLSDMDILQMGGMIELPALFFHGTFDEETPAWQGEDAAAACPNASLCLVEGAAHGQARYIDGSAYYETLFSFYESALTE